jgi:chromosomal replication initiator protein DnaA
LAEAYEFPKGVTTKSTAGGAEVIRKLLVGLKRFSFTGYVRTHLATDSSKRTGNIVVKEGSPVLAIYRVETPDGSQDLSGQVALRKTWEDSYNPQTVIEVHGGVSVDPIINALPDSIIDPSQGQKQRAVVGLKWGEDGAEAKALKAKVEEFRAAGFVVDDLEAALEKGMTDARHSLAVFESNLAKIKVLGGMLTSITAAELQKDVERVRRRFNDPMRIVAIESDIEELRERAEQMEKSHSDIVEVKGSQKAHGQIFPEDRFKCEVCGYPLRPGTECQRCGGKPARKPATVEKVRKVAIATAESANLNKEFTFDNFVVGESNRFTHVAGMAVASMKEEAYVPLFIWSGSGLGKTHILNAIGNSVVANFPGKRVLYVGAQRFVKEILEAIEKGSMEAFRSKYRSLDLMLIDDVQFLSQTEAVQDELFAIFNELKGKGKYVVLASDRPPPEIKGIADRLSSRFASGLVTDIQPPEVETRIAILRKKAEERKLELDDEVLMHIATQITGSIRALESALTKVSAYSALLGAEVTVDTVKEVLKEDGGQHREEAPALPTQQQVTALKLSHSYLVEEEKPQRCFELFGEHVRQGYVGLAITRTNPTRIKESHDLSGAQVIWLTDREGGAEDRIAPVLERIIYKIEELVDRGETSILLVDGLEYLISSNNFESVLKFLRRLIDEVSESKCILLMSLTPGTLGDKEQKILKREMEVISG